MGSAPQPPSSRPSLDDLLRFKRAERPAPEFWAEFDRGLRQKQLAALMKRPKGWARVRPAFARSLRWVVPATAAAAVALVVIQVPLTTSRPTPMEVASRPAGTEALALSHGAEGRQAPIEATAAQPNPMPVVAVALPAATTAPHSAPDTAAPREHFLPWSTVAVAENALPTRRFGENAPVSSPVRETRRPRSSWTSRFNEIVQEFSIEEAPGRSFQLASLALPAVDRSAPVLVAAAATPASVPVSAKMRPANERDFRDLESRFGVTGSSLSIKF